MSPAKEYTMEPSPKLNPRGRPAGAWVVRHWPSRELVARFRTNGLRQADAWIWAQRPKRRR